MDILDVLGTVFSIFARILIPLSINLDCRARNLAQRKLFTILSFFFPVLIGIIYAIRRKSLQKAFKVCSKCGSKADPYAANCPKCGGYMLLEYKNPKAKMLKTISIVLCVVGVLAYSAGEFIGLPSYIDEIKEQILAITEGDVGDAEDDDDYIIDEGGLWYDRNGIAYSNYYSIKFYDENGKEYYFETDEDVYDIIGVLDEDGNKYEYDKSFINEDGYFCYGVEAELGDDGIFVDSDGNKYYLTNEVNWTYSGEMQYIYDMV